MRAIQTIGQIVEIMYSKSECHCYNVLFLLQIQYQWHDFIVNYMKPWSTPSCLPPRSHEIEWATLYLLDPVTKTLNYLSIQFHSYSVICRHIYRYNSTRWYICTPLTEVMKTRLLWFNIWKCKKEKNGWHNFNKLIFVFFKTSYHLQGHNKIFFLDILWQNLSQSF